jgi:hypothetical protein
VSGVGDKENLEQEWPRRQLVGGAAAKSFNSPDLGTLRERLLTTVAQSSAQSSADTIISNMWAKLSMHQLEKSVLGLNVMTLVKEPDREVMGMLVGTGGGHSTQEITERVKMSYVKSRRSRAF